MNLRPQGFKLSKAILGFLQYKSAEALSSRTLRSYEHDLKLWLEHAGDVEVGQVSAQDIRAYLVWLRTDYKPQRLTGGAYPLAPKTLRNIWVSLAAFFAWITREFEVPNPMKSVPAPKFEEKPVEPFTKEDIEQVLKVCDYCAEARTNDRRRFTMRRCTANRDHAMILTLLDTGLRASELCALKVGDLEMKTGKLEVKHGAAGGVALPGHTRGWRRPSRAHVCRQVQSPIEPRWPAPIAGRVGQEGPGQGMSSASFSPYVCHNLSTFRRRSVHPAGAAGA